MLKELLYMVGDVCCHATGHHGLYFLNDWALFSRILTCSICEFRNLPVVRQWDQALVPLLWRSCVWLCRSWAPLVWLLTALSVFRIHPLGWPSSTAPASRKGCRSGRIIVLVLGTLPSSQVTTRSITFWIPPPSSGRFDALTPYLLPQCSGSVRRRVMRAFFRPLNAWGLRSGSGITVIFDMKISLWSVDMLWFGWTILNWQYNHVRPVMVTWQILRKSKTYHSLVVIRNACWLVIAP